MTSGNETKIARKHSWWWRKETSYYTFDPESHTIRSRNHDGDLWKLNIERGAWRYELARRHLPTKWMLPFQKMDPAITSLLSEPPTKIYRSGAIPIQQDLDCWDDFWSDLGKISWNLRASEALLSKTFLDLIHRERHRLKVPNPAELPNKAASFWQWPSGKHVSWRWPEVLDLKTCAVQLKPGDRRKLLVARKAASRFYKALIEAIQAE